MARMSSPALGRVSSEYGNRPIYGFHAGIDIATGGKPGTVHATFAGTVAKIIRGRRPGQPASSGSVLAPGRSGNGVIILNPDGERQLYGHVQVPSSLRLGAKVDVGDVLGVTDLSGITTGYHVHYEEWTRSGATRNPRASFARFGVTPGAAPVKASAPAPTPSSGYPHKPVGTNLADLKSAWYRLLGALGYKGTTTQRMQYFLRASGHYLGPIDDVWGAGTTRALQLRLRSAGHDPGPADGVRGPKTRAAEAAYLNAHAWRAK